MKLTTRRRNIISGLIALVLMVGTTTIGVKWAFGEFDDGYVLQADFAAAGQGLVEGSDVKVRGLDVGHVQSIELRNGRALVTMFINDGHDIPRDTSTFTIRPKTLFGEKFVDVILGPDEGTGPFFGDGDEVPRFFDEDDEIPEEALRDSEGRALRSAGGFELERVLADAFPILEAIDPDDVAVILDELARGGAGMGETINRAIVNGEQVLDVQANRDAETRQFLEDLADLSGELADRAPDLIAGAEDLNVALPVLIENPEALNALLIELERTSGEIADLLEANTEFIDSVYTDGQAVLDVLFGRRDQVVPLVVGIREYVRVVASAARIPVGDGTVMAAVKGLIGAEGCGFVVCNDPPQGEPGVPPPPLPGLPLPPLPLDLLAPLDGEVSRGTAAVLDLVGGLTEGPR
jgi:phospholipid/cholesterol/gamma-HCH transport system substrate-binding protein